MNTHMQALIMASRRVSGAYWDGGEADLAAPILSDAMLHLDAVTAQCEATEPTFGRSILSGIADSLVAGGIVAGGYILWTADFDLSGWFGGWVAALVGYAIAHVRFAMEG